MSERIRVVGLGGSLAPASKSLAALRIALDAAEAGADVELFDIRALDLPLFRPGMGEAPAAARRWAEAACEASGLLWRSPLYHGTISGSFKNALDWLHILADRDPPYLTDKVIGLISTAGGVQGLQAVNTMEFVVRTCEAGLCRWCSRSHAPRRSSMPMARSATQSWRNSCVR